MKIRFLILLLLPLLTISCKSTELDSAEASVPSTDTTAQVQPKEEEPLEPPVDEEYLRSINNLSESETVSVKEFTDDKATILKIISELSEIMQTRNYTKWLDYIDSESQIYYSNPINLRKAQKKLPIKNLQLNNLKDYFNYVFIPSRKVSNVDEIRYISKTNIKAVHVKPDFSTVVYYYFVKKDGKWLVHLPPLQ